MGELERGTEVLEAWRVYSIGNTGALRPLTIWRALAQPGRLLLDTGQSLDDEFYLTYQIGERYTALCCKEDLALPFVRGHLSDNKCTCGFYGRQSQEQAFDYLIHHVRPHRQLAFAIGPVLLEGIVVVGVTGFRAETMTVLPPEKVIFQEDLMNPVSMGQFVLSGRVASGYHKGRLMETFSPGNWNGARVVTWAEWKDKIEPWISERLRRSSKLYPSLSRYRHPHQSPYPRNTGTLRASISKKLWLF